MKAAGVAGDILSVEPLSGGFRNTMSLVTVSPGERYVLRRYLDARMGQIEVALLRRLRGELPVPRVLHAAGEGRLVAVMEFVDGLSLDTVIRGGTAGDLEAIGLMIGRVLADIGRVQFDRPGFLRPGLIPGGQNLATIDMILPYVHERLFRQDVEAALGTRKRDAYWNLLERNSFILESLIPETHLVHADFNGKNILVYQVAGRWHVKALIDWEFAFSGTQLFDVANMLRHEEAIPAAFTRAFVKGFAQNGGYLPPHWRRICRILDTPNIAEFLARGPENPFFEQSRGIILSAVARGDL